MAEERYEGKDVTITFDGARCIHARRCVLTLPDVFRANVEGPWIDPDGAPADEIRALARRCPSGAIQAWNPDGSLAETPPATNVVYVVENGPLNVRGELKMPDGSTRIRATLCRCGASRTKPYCDGTHEAIGFDATGEPTPDASIEPVSERGPLTIDPRRNGPLKVVGPVEVVKGGTGKTVRKTSRCFLCRCGQSQNKPFCDGTHGKVGFEAD